MINTDETYIVGVNHSDSGKVVLIIGKHDIFGQMELVNAFGGEEAMDLYSRLTVKEKVGV